MPHSRCARILYRGRAVSHGGEEQCASRPASVGGNPRYLPLQQGLTGSDPTRGHAPVFIRLTLPIAIETDRHRRVQTHFFLHGNRLVSGETTEIRE